MYLSYGFLGGFFESKCRPNWQEITGKEQGHTVGETQIPTTQECAHWEPPKKSYFIPLHSIPFQKTMCKTCTDILKTTSVYKYYMTDRPKSINQSINCVSIFGHNECF